MRRLLIPATLVVAVGAAALWRTWAERTHQTVAERPEPGRTALPRDTGLPEAEAVESGGTAEGDAPVSQGLLRGVVSGPTGTLFGVRIVAYRAGTDGVLVETSTNPSGAYSLAVDPGIAFDFAVEPMSQTGLLGVRRDAIALAAGEERVEDIALALGAFVRGRIVDPDGKGMSGIAVVAVRPGEVRSLTTSAGVATSFVAARGVSGDDGWFRLRGLAPGPYELAVENPEWMFLDPVSVRTDGPEVSLAVVSAFTLNLSVRNAETEGPVPAFSVRARMGETILEAEGIDGVFSRRLPWPGRRERLYPMAVEVEVAAPGLVAPRPFVSSGRPHAVWLWPSRDPNTTARVSFDDGTAYTGGLMAIFKAKEGKATGSVRFERDREGVLRAALPRGRFDLTVIPEGAFGTPRIEAEAEVAEGRDASLSLVLKSGGSLVFFPPPGREWCDVNLWSLEAPTRKVTRDGMEVATATGAEHVITVRREGTRVEGIPPGEYHVGYFRKVEHEGTTYNAVKWFREIQVVVGGTEEIRVPSE